MAQITYADKVAINENPNVNAINKIRDEDMNEIKSVVNQNATALNNLTTKVSTINTPTLINQRAYSSGWQTEGTYSNNAKYLYFLLMGGAYGSFGIIIPVSVFNTLTQSVPYVIANGTTPLYQFAYEDGNIRGYFRSSATDYSVSVYEIN